MKLELKHLSAYLPYGIKRYRPNSVDLIREIDYLELNQSMIDYHEKVKWKPILRPLSDLIREIEHNESKFIPTVWLRDNCGNFDVSKKDMETLISMFLHIFRNPISAPYYFIEKLLEWHFDVFGLIDAGLAIDINTLNK